MARGKRKKRRRQGGGKQARGGRQRGVAGPRSAGTGSARAVPVPEVDVSELGETTHELARVRDLQSAGRPEDALGRAKALYAREGCGDGEGGGDARAAPDWLLQAYAVRIDGLIRDGLPVEAEALIGVVGERFDRIGPVARRRAYLAAWGGDVRELLAPLADPDLPEERRRAVEQDVRRWLSDPADLASADVLPSDHPLRVQAGAVSQVLDRVTTAPAKPAEYALGEVPRRSPLVTLGGLGS